MRDMVGSLILILLLTVTASGQAGGGQNPRPPRPVVPSGPPDRPSVRITGRIIAPGAAQPPENVDVRIETSAGIEVGFAFTDGLGGFEFRDVELVPNESHYVVVEAAGFETVRERIDYQIDPRRGGRLNVQLRAERPEPADGDDDGLRVVDVGQLLADVPEDARREYERALEDVDDDDYEDAIERLEWVVALAPDFYDAFDALGAAYLSIRQHSEAEAALTRALELSPGAARPLLNLGTLSYQIGEAHLEAERFDDALEAFGRSIEFLEESIRREPLAATAFHHLGAVLHRVGRYEGAETALHEALRLDPALGDARLVLINVYSRQRRFDDALGQLDAYVDENPDSDRLPALERVRDQIESARQQ